MGANSTYCSIFVLQFNHNKTPNIMPTIKLLKLTAHESAMLEKVALFQNEDNQTDFDYLTLTPQEKGVVGSMVKKGLLYDCADYPYDSHPRWVLSQTGLDMCNRLGIDLSHIIFY
jgi:hypothetical protein